LGEWEPGWPVELCRRCSSMYLPSTWPSSAVLQASWGCCLSSLAYCHLIEPRELPQSKLSVTCSESIQPRPLLSRVTNSLSCVTQGLWHILMEPLCSLTSGDSPALCDRFFRGRDSIVEQGESPFFRRLGGPAHADHVNICTLRENNGSTATNPGGLKAGHRG